MAALTGGDVDPYGSQRLMARHADDWQGEALGWWLEGEVGSTVAALIRDGSSGILDSGMVCEGINVNGVQMKHGEGNHEEDCTVWLEDLETEVVAVHSIGTVGRG